MSIDRLDEFQLTADVLLSTLSLLSLSSKFKVMKYIKDTDLSNNEAVLILKNSLIPKRLSEVDINYSPTTAIYDDYHASGVYNISKHIVKEDTILYNGQQLATYKNNDGILIKQITRNKNGTISEVRDNIHREVNDLILKFNGKKFNQDQFNTMNNSLSFDTDDNNRIELVETIKIDNDNYMKIIYRNFVDSNGIINYNNAAITEQLYDNEYRVHIFTTNNSNHCDDYEVQFLPEGLVLETSNSFNLDLYNVTVSNCVTKKFSEYIIVNSPRGKKRRLKMLLEVVVDANNDIVKEDNGVCSTYYYKDYIIKSDYGVLTAYNKDGKKVNAVAFYKSFRDSLIDWVIISI